ncbi:MAG: DegV family protein [Limnochordia bacterium]
MEKIAIVTDSTCDLPANLVEEYDIHVLPLRIIYKDREYRDHVEITPEDVYNRLETEVPTTSLPNPGDVQELFTKLKEEGYSHVLAIHISSGLSGTSQMIRHVAQEIQGLMVEVIDSKSISMGLGYTVLEAAKAIRKNITFEALCDHVHGVIKRMKVYFVLDTLEYLKKGGRIGKVSATLGQILNVKPIITVNEEGIYTTFAKVRGRRRSLEKLIEIAKDHVQQALSNIAVCHGAAPADCGFVAAALEKLENVQELIQSHVSPVIGVHTGPGTLGIVIYEAQD